MPKLTNSYTHLGGSDASKICYGANRFGNSNEDHRQSLVKKTVGEGGFFGSQKAIDRGNTLEPALAEWTVRELHKGTEKAIKVIDNSTADIHPTYKIASSCDLKLLLPEPIDVKCPITNHVFQVEGLIPVEIKTDGYNKGEPHRDFEAQLRHQMICLDAEYGIITKLGPNLEMAMYPYERDREWDADYLELVSEFWRKVEEDEPYPDLTSNEYVADLNALETSEEMLMAIEGLQDLEAKKKHHDDMIDDIKATIKKVLRKHECDQGVIGPYIIKINTIQRKATPERVVPAKPAGEPYERLSIKLNNGDVN
tara:strand:+ start:63 stop:992 length:930 start_codon:yes stop_codon:yes gene_type:complete